MKIAVASEEGYVSENFNQCQEFTIFKIQGERVVKKIPFKSYDNETQELPEYLIGHGIEVVIVGCVGNTPVKLFHENGIKIVLNVKSDINQAVEGFLKGQLKPVKTNYIDENSCCNKQQCKKGSCY
ncbi:NifB/NifX family molybdenum-iron cluster-binding protein [Proteinivorax tanatarense]|uniref:NifB/NifX family molybdenum-iron cluster-binding protein n=1 Tax=Proteinivorax tanatarense TaxID=1260629 RepID=A0AAU7VM96_9FIRM